MLAQQWAYEQCCANCGRCCGWLFSADKGGQWVDCVGMAMQKVSNAVQWQQQQKQQQQKQQRQQQQQQQQQQLQLPQKLQQQTPHMHQNVLSCKSVKTLLTCKVGASTGEGLAARPAAMAQGTSDTSSAAGASAVAGRAAELTTATAATAGAGAARERATAEAAAATAGGSAATAGAAWSIRLSTGSRADGSEAKLPNTKCSLAVGKAGTGGIEGADGAAQKVAQVPKVGRSV